MSLNREIVRELIRLGTENEGRIIDPSESDILRESGVAPVTAHIEKLGLLNLTKDAQPIFGKNGGMWIGYTLTEKGLDCGGDESLLETILSGAEKEITNEVSLSVLELMEFCQNKNLKSGLKDDFLKTLEEIAICFQNKCYIATISMCGKVLEICLSDVLHRHNIPVPRNTTIGNLIRYIRDKLPEQYLDPALQNVANVISRSRNTAIHYNEVISIPSRDQTIMVIFAIKDFVHRCFTTQ